VVQLCRFDYNKLEIISAANFKTSEVVQVPGGERLKNKECLAVHYHNVQDLTEIRASTCASK
jgi:hypothetical protein